MTTPRHAARSASCHEGGVMSYTGGGDPLPAQVGCRWCDYETEQYRANSPALTDLLDHVKASHPTEYAAVVERPKKESAL